MSPNLDVKQQLRQFCWIILLYLFRTHSARFNTNTKTQTPSTADHLGRGRHYENLDSYRVVGRYGSWSCSSVVRHSIIILNSLIFDQVCKEILVSVRVVVKFTKKYFIPPIFLTLFCFYRVIHIHTVPKKLEMFWICETNWEVF